MISLDKRRNNKFPYEEAKEKGLIDELCIPLCDIFNELGITTLFCCQGHEEGDTCTIMFESSIGDDEIINFIKFANDIWPDCIYWGDFLKWHRYHNGVLLVNWLFKITGTLEDMKDSIEIATKRLRKVADYIRDEVAADMDKLIVYPGKGEAA